MANTLEISKILEKIADDAALVKAFAELLKTTDKAVAEESTIKADVYLLCVEVTTREGVKHLHPVVMGAPGSAKMVESNDLVALQRNTETYISQIKRTTGHTTRIIGVTADTYSRLNTLLNDLIEQVSAKVDEAVEALAEASRLAGKVNYNPDGEKSRLMAEVLHLGAIAGSAVVDNGTIVDRAEEDYDEDEEYEEYEEDGDEESEDDEDSDYDEYEDYYEE